MFNIEYRDRKIKLQLFFTELRKIEASQLKNKKVSADRTLIEIRKLGKRFIEGKIEGKNNKVTFRVNYSSSGGFAVWLKIRRSTADAGRKPGREREKDGSRERGVERDGE